MRHCAMDPKALMKERDRLQAILDDVDYGSSEQRADIEAQITELSDQLDNIENPFR